MTGASFFDVCRLIIALLLTAACTDARQLLQLALLHRHGARTEPFVSDHGLNWDSCVLSESGVEMALSLGRFTKNKYESFLPRNYSYRIIDSISTDFERTIRTGVGFLRGMYNSTDAIPFLEHKPQNKDFLLGYYYSWPSAVLGTEYIQSYNMRNNADTLSYFPQEKLDVIGNTLGCPILCKENQTLCALLGEDVSTCRLSNGGLTPNLTSLFPQMFEAQEKSNAFLYLYNESDPYWRATGPYGRLLAVDIIDTFEQTAEVFGVNGSLPEALLRHFSAHDVTIYSFFSAIGAVRPGVVQEDILVPNFASAVFLEVYSDANVSVAFYECNQSYGSGFPYSRVGNVTIGCKPTPPASQEDYVDVYYDVECPLQHFRNFVDLKKPLFPSNGSGFPDKPWCYADPQDERINACWRNSTDAPNAECAQYRLVCPEFACDETLNLILDRTTYRCVSIASSTATDAAWGSSLHRNAGWYVGIVFSSVLIGIVLGAALKFIAFERQSKSEAPLMDAS